MTLSAKQRIAISEDFHLIALLVDATTPHAKELALIVAARIAAIADLGEDSRELTDLEIETWVGIARKLVREAGLEIQRAKGAT